MFSESLHVEPQSKPKEKRLIRRKPPKRGVTASCRKGLMGLGSDLAVRTIDISDSGICLIISQELKRGDDCEVQLNGLGRSKPLKLLCEVRWIVPDEDFNFRVGLQFRKKIPYAELTHYC